MFVAQRSTGRRPRHWHAPDSLEEAAALLEEHAGQVRVGAGCTYLMLMAAHGEVQSPHLVSVHRIPGLQEVSTGRVGSGVTLAALERGARNGPERALTMAASVTAGPSIRNLGTLGGNLGFADGDLVPAAMALDATVHLDDRSEVPVGDYVTARPPDRIATAISYPLRREDGWSGATVKLAHRGMDWPIVTVSAAVQVADDGEILAARVAAQALAAEPTRLAGAEAILVGSHGEDEALVYAGEESLSRLEIRADQEATAAYRRRVAPAVVRRALQVALRHGPHDEVDLMEARR